MTQKEFEEVAKMAEENKRSYKYIMFSDGVKMRTVDLPLFLKNVEGGDNGLILPFLMQPKQIKYSELIMLPISSIKMVKLTNDPYGGELY